MISLSCMLLSIALAPQDHEQRNPLFKELRQSGVAVGTKAKSLLPAPSMADGLDAKAQQAVIAALAGQDYAVEELQRNSIVAPYIYKHRDLDSADPQLTALAVDVWFIAYGDLKVLGNNEFLEKSVTAQKDRKLRVLSDADLAKRKLERATAGSFEERYSHTVFSILDRVELSATTRATMSRTADSVLFAVQLDPRFQAGRDFPNQWRSIDRDDQGNFQYGQPAPYSGSAGYLKITKLAVPAGALLVEYHLVFTEPKKWFGGANLLRPKLPLLVQSETRSFRKEVARTLKAE